MLSIRVAVAKAVVINLALVLNSALTILAPLIVVAIATRLVLNVGEAVVIRCYYVGEETIEKIRVKIKKLKLIKKEGVLSVGVATTGLYIGTIITLSSR
jgi:hypothetical protein